MIWTTASSGSTADALVETAEETGHDSRIREAAEVLESYARTDPEYDLWFVVEVREIVGMAVIVVVVGVVVVVSTFQCSKLKIREKPVARARGATTYMDCNKKVIRTTTMEIQK